jgi:hypothetical protein
MPTVLFGVLGKLLASREPDSWFGLHISDQIVEVLHGGAVATQVWMEGKDKRSALLVGPVELLFVCLKQKVG